MAWNKQLQAMQMTRGWWAGGLSAPPFVLSEGGWARAAWLTLLPFTPSSSPIPSPLADAQTISSLQRDFKEAASENVRLSLESASKVGRAVRAPCGWMVAVDGCAACRKGVRQRVADARKLLTVASTATDCQ